MIFGLLIVAVSLTLGFAFGDLSDYDGKASSPYSIAAAVGVFIFFQNLLYGNRR